MNPDLLLYVGVGFIMLLLGAVFFGAPYVPTRRKDIDKVFKIISKKDVLVDLGSGDGRLVRSAAEKGIRSYGIELSPILAFASWVYLWRFRDIAQIKWGNYWRKTLPDDTTVVFVFLADVYMKKLQMYMEAEAARLNRPLTLISYGFSLPEGDPVRTEGALLIYRIKP